MKYTVIVKQIYTYENIEAETKEQAMEKIINLEWSDADNIEVKSKRSK